jgi:hypothetical protein
VRKRLSCRATATNGDNLIGDEINARVTMGRRAIDRARHKGEAPQHRTKRPFIAAALRETLPTYWHRLLKEPFSTLFNKGRPRVGTSGFNRAKWLCCLQRKWSDIRRSYPRIKLRSKLKL